MLNLHSLFQSVDEQKRRNPALAAAAPQFTNQPAPAFDTPLGAPAPMIPVTPDAQVAEIANRQPAMSVNDILKLTIPQIGQTAPQSGQVAPVATAIAAPALNSVAPQLSGSQQTQQQIQQIKEKDYSKGVYRRPDGTETSHPTTNGVQNEVVKAAGADRKKSWSTGDKIRNGIIGALIGFSQGGLGGAISGGLMSGTDRSYDLKRKDAQLLGKLRPQLAEQQNYEISQAKQQKANFDAQNSQIEGQGKVLSNQKTAGEITKQDVDTINSRVKPLLDAFQSDKKIDQKEADILTKMTGLPYSPAQWQTYVETEVNGKHLIRPEFDPNYVPNTTLPINAKNVPYNYKLPNEQTIPLLPGQIASTEVGIAQNDAAREATRIKTNSDIESDNNKNLDGYEKSLLQAKKDRTNIEAQIIGHSDLIAQLNQAQQDLQIKLSPQGGLNPYTDKEEINRIRSQMVENEKQIREKSAEINRLKIQKSGIEEPVKPRSTKQIKSVPQLGNKGGRNNNVGTRSDYRKALSRIK